MPRIASSALDVPLPAARRDGVAALQQEAVLQPRRLGGHAAVGHDEQELAVATVDRAEQFQVGVEAHQPVLVAGRQLEVDDALVGEQSRGRRRS